MASVFFELDRFELTDEHRLSVTGRWFGVRGRRFVRPTLTLRTSGGHSRSLADLAHKPWAAEDGMPWHAEFAVAPDDATVLEAELAVAPDIEIALPAPGGESQAGIRIRAPRQRGVGELSWSGTASRPRGAAPVRTARREIMDARHEIERLAGELESARREVERLAGELEAARREVTAALAWRDEAEAELARAGAERDAAVAARDAATAERDGAARANVELEHRVVELDHQVAARDGRLDELMRVVDDRDGRLEKLRRAVADATLGWPS